jgi:hypothetical protein
VPAQLFSCRATPIPKTRRDTADPQEIIIEYAGGKQKTMQGCVLDSDTSQKIFRRNGEVIKIAYTTAIE